MIKRPRTLILLETAHYINRLLTYLNCSHCIQLTTLPLNGWRYYGS